MIELLTKGGWVMYAIFAASVSAVAIIIERSIFYYSTKNNFGPFIDSFIKSLNDLGPKKIINHISEERGGLHSIAHIYIEHSSLPKEVLDEYLFNISNYEIKKQESHLSILSAIGHLAPLMGLLGTVIGMISCFRGIQSLGGHVDVSILAGGIWEALLTTAFGLIVAIPVIGVHHYLESIVDCRTDDIQRLVSEMDIYFKKT